jgi:hypothetical protein
MLLVLHAIYRNFFGSDLTHRYKIPCIQRRSKDIDGCMTENSKLPCFNRKYLNRICWEGFWPHDWLQIYSPPIGMAPLAVTWPMVSQCQVMQSHQGMEFPLRMAVCAIYSRWIVLQTFWVARGTRKPCLCSAAFICQDDKLAQPPPWLCPWIRSTELQLEVDNGIYLCENDDIPAPVLSNSSSEVSYVISSFLMRSVWHHSYILCII